VNWKEEDRSHLGGLQVGQTVDFELERGEGVHKITSLAARAPATAVRLDAVRARPASGS